MTVEIQELQEQINTLVENLKPYKGMRERFDEQRKKNNEAIVAMAKSDDVCLAQITRATRDQYDLKILQLEDYADFSRNMHDNTIKILEGVVTILSDLTNKEGK
jgi:hypothetical protein